MAEMWDFNSNVTGGLPYRDIWRNLNLLAIKSEADHVSLS
jgi:hypothetical protein